MGRRSSNGRPSLARFLYKDSTFHPLAQSHTKPAFLVETFEFHNVPVSIKICIALSIISMILSIDRKITPISSLFSGSVCMVLCFLFVSTPNSTGIINHPLKSIVVRFRSRGCGRPLCYVLSYISMLNMLPEISFILPSYSFS